MTELAVKASYSCFINIVLPHITYYLVTGTKHHDAIKEVLFSAEIMSTVKATKFL